jgi:hypothetical protein
MTAACRRSETSWLTQDRPLSCGKVAASCFLEAGKCP